MSDDTYNADATMDAFERKEYARVFEVALPWAQNGNPDAQCMLSLLYQCGLGVEANGIAAELWLLRAAAQNSAVAWNNLGSLYISGAPGLPSNKARAIQCYQRAHELGFDCCAQYPPDLDWLGRE